ncbi:GtrA-like protein [Filimonas lacunae]|uniref:GtrA-like protein n=2 Tax=Filimonas lacunae TaxID=477680 RepID=A0A1N7PEA2_9BACT|nr:GtrA-like protein [Filimonas lacunae]
MPLQTFRYAVCGGGNTVLSIALLSIAHNFIFNNEIVQLPFGLAMTSYIAAYVLQFCITFPLGFYLSLYVVFPESHLRRRIQLFRYLLVVAGSFMLNYVLLKFFIENLGWYPTPAMAANCVVVITFSYVSQRYFSFRTKKQSEPVKTEA